MIRWGKFGYGSSFAPLVYNEILVDRELIPVEGMN